MAENVGSTMAAFEAATREIIRYLHCNDVWPTPELVRSMAEERLAGTTEFSIGGAGGAREVVWGGGGAGGVCVAGNDGGGNVYPPADDGPTGPLTSGIASKRDVDDRSIELLKQWLSPRQLADFEDFGCFDVIGSDTGRRYRITDEPVYNIWNGKERICVVPTPVLSAGLGDRLLAQKIALETSENITLGKANRGSRRQSYPAAG